MKKLKPILLLVLVFAAGVFVGIAGTRIAVRNFIRRAVHEPNFLRTRVERDLARQLKLDAAQQDRVRQALVEAQGELKAVGADVRPRLRAVLAKANAGIESALTPEQREKYHRILAENRARWELP